MSQEGGHLSPEIFVPGNTDGDEFPVGMQVLAIDSSPVCLAYLVQLLKQCEYKVTATTKADEALALLRDKKNKFDIVITDVMRNDSHGFKLLEIISLEMDIPVILLSVKDDYESVMKGIWHGARDYIIKPPRIEEMKKIWLHVYRKKLEHQGNQQKKFSDSIKESMEQKELRLKRDRERGKDVINDTYPDQNPSCKKERLSWAPELHQKFVDCVVQLGIENAVPSKILNLMNVPGLTREKVGSHLQKFRQSLNKGAAKRNGTGSSNTSMDSRPNNQTGLQSYRDSSSHIINQMPQHVKNQRQETPSFVPQFQHLLWQNPNLGGLQLQQQEHAPPVGFPPDTLRGGRSTSPLYSATDSSQIFSFSSLLFTGSSCQITNFPQQHFASRTPEIPLPAGLREVTNSANSASEDLNMRHRSLDPFDNVSGPAAALRRRNDNTRLENHLQRHPSTGDDEITTLVRQFIDDRPPTL